MKITVLFCIGCVLASTSLFGQRIDDALMKQITRETCDELGKVDFSKKTPNEVKLALGLSMVKVVGLHQSELKGYGLSLEDPKSLEGLGTEVGMRLATSCPVFVDALTRNPNTIEELANRTSPTKSISGKLLKIVSGDFTYLQVEDASGKIEKLWWMEYFEGSNRLLVDAKSQLNRPVRINYTEKDVFNSTLNDYVKIKVITGIE